MTLRPLNNRSLQNYPKIQIDRGSVIKPCVAEQTGAHLVDKSASSWKKIFYDVWYEGVPFILRHISNLKVPNNSNKYYTFLVQAIKYVALLMLHIHRVYLYIYEYFYPYSLMSLDEVCKEFARCSNWNESVIRAFAWHPNYNRCALAVCNDFVYVYEEATRIRVLRHNHQRKIVDIAWQPNNKEILVVASQTHIIIWRISETTSGLRDISKSSNFTYLAPGLHFIKKDKELNIGSVSRNENLNGFADNSLSSQSNDKNMRILENILPPPITSIQFDQTGNKLYACSPNSSKIAILDISKIFNNSPAQNDSNDKNIKYLRKFGQGVTKLLWSPQKNRLASANTSLSLRVFEPFKWTCNKWPIQGGIIQDMVWSKPSGHMLLIANKNEPYLYSLPFLDTPQANDVGGNKSIMRALDLSATRNEFGGMVGGRVQSLAWDKNGKRLAISFKDNPESILLYKTAERPTVEFQQLGMIQSDNGSLPLLLDFHDKFENGSLLTICWSDGNCQHIPLSYGPQEQNNRNGMRRDDQFDKSFDQSMINLNETNQSPKTPKSLTNFCHVSGNNSISSFSTSLLPINKVQHQTTLFSLSAKLPYENNISSTSSDS